jgi:hypothetical protein
MSVGEFPREISFPSTLHRQMKFVGPDEPPLATVKDKDSGVMDIPEATMFVMQNSIPDCPEEAFFEP